MRALFFLLLFALVGAEAVAKVETFNGGAFTVSLNVDPESWSIESQPKLSFIRFQKAGGVNLARGSAFEGYVYVDRMAEPAVPADLQGWFGRYLKQREGFLNRKVFDRVRPFHAAKANPVLIAEMRLLRFDRVRQLLSTPASRMEVAEEGVVYFFMPPGFEKHKTFFVFTGRQVLSRDHGHRSELGEVENMIKGFELARAKPD